MPGSRITITSLKPLTLLWSESEQHDKKQASSYSSATDPNDQPLTTLAENSITNGSRSDRSDRSVAALSCSDDTQNIDNNTLVY